MRRLERTSLFVLRMKIRPRRFNSSEPYDLNLVEGREAIVESPTGEFDPFVVHYAETFIIPESVKQYTIRPYGESEGKQCATIKAFVKHNV